MRRCLRALNLDLLLFEATQAVCIYISLPDLSATTVITAAMPPKKAQKGDNKPKSEKVSVDKTFGMKV